MPSITVDPSSDFVEAKPEQVPPTAGQKSLSIAPTAAPRQAPPLVGKLTSSSALGGAVPIAFRVKKIAFKKSSL